MIVARSFSPPSSSYMTEKNDLNRSSSSSTRSLVRHRSQSPKRYVLPQTRTTKSPPPPQRSEPVRIPSKKSKPMRLQDPAPVVQIPAQPTSAADRQAQQLLPQAKKQSAQDILSATAIPIRRRPRGRQCQKLPNGDYVADFSKLLLDDFQPNKDGTLSRNQSLTQMDVLFGNIDELVEGQIFVDNESVDESGLSARSISSDSLSSLASPEDYGSSHLDTRSSMGRSPQRNTPRITPAEDCSTNHPLVELEKLDDFSLNSTEPNVDTAIPTPQRPNSPPVRSSKKESSRLSFKSTLTSSLKALKSAARTTLLSSSGFGPHGGISSPNIYTNESLLAHNFFDIQPSLTDDRRPPPTMTRPSPELRRYLNPQMASGPPDSPTQLHFWQDERYTYDPKREAQLMKEKKQKSRRKRSPGTRSKIDSLPPIVPLSTCLPPAVRTANASSPPIWLTPDGDPVNKNTSNALLFDPDATTVSSNGMPKNREPRENRDFLRMYVCEMAMRRSGKLSDDISAGRARLWLPPVPSTTNSIDPTSRKQGVERWHTWTADGVAESETV